MKMQGQTRFNKGLMDIKEKSEVILIPRELQQFSPNTSQTKSFAKEINVGGVSNEITYKVQQPGLNAGATQTHFQKYNNNLINSSNANKSLYNSHNSSNYNSTAIKLNSQFCSQQPQLKPQESFKNLNSNIKKNKEQTTQNLNLISKPEISPLKKLDLLIKKKAVVSSHVSSSKASISLAGTGAVNSSNVSTRLNPGINNVSTQDNQATQLLESSNLINIKLSQEALRLRRNEENIYSNPAKLNSLPSTEFFSPGKAVQATTQDTRDSTSNSSSVKRHKHTKSGDFPKDQSFKNNIKNPEDLHYFYVNTIQANKEFMDKFDVQDD